MCDGQQKDLNWKGENVLNIMRRIRIVVASAALAAFAGTIGCAGASVRVGYRAYDPYRSDYHVWDANEGVFYNQWVVETRRNSGRDFRRLRKPEREEYWRWRHDHDRR